MLVCPLTPRIVDQSLLPRLELEGKMRGRRRLAHDPAGELEETGRPVERYPAIVLDLQAFEIPRQVELAIPLVLLGLDSWTATNIS